MYSNENVFVQSYWILYSVPASAGAQGLLVRPPMARFDHEIFSVVIFSLPLIQEGQLSVSGKRVCTILVNSLED